MSDIERPWVERRRSGPPSSCPVCGAATMEVRIAGVITCRSAGLDHFEWRPDAGAVVSVSSERADEWKCSWCRGHSPAAETRCRFCDIERPRPAVETGADNRRYDKSLTMPLPQPRPEGYSCTHTPRCRDRRDVGDPEWSATELACGRVEVEGPRDDNFAETDLAEFYEALRPTGPLDEIVREGKRRMDAAGHPPPIEGEILGVDYRAACAGRLSPDVARFATLHRPLWGTPPTCEGCRPAGGPPPRRSTVLWPCATASLALEMMGLTASDIAITDE